MAAVTPLPAGEGVAVTPLPAGEGVADPLTQAQTAPAAPEVRTVSGRLNKHDSAKSAFSRSGSQARSQSQHGASMSGVRFSQRTYRVSERDGEVHLKVERQGVNSAAAKGYLPIIDVEVRTRDGNGALKAKHGEHYGAVQVAVTLDTNDVVTGVVVPIYEREELEPIVEFFAEIYDPYTYELLDTASVLITDTENHIVVFFAHILNLSTYEIAYFLVYTFTIIAPQLQVILLDKRYDAPLQIAYAACAVLYFIDMILQFIVRRAEYVLSSNTFLDACALLGVLLLCDWFLVLCLHGISFTGEGNAILAQMCIVWGHIMRSMKVGPLVGNLTNGIVAGLSLLQTRKDGRRREKVLAGKQDEGDVEEGVVSFLRTPKDSRSPLKNQTSLLLRTRDANGTFGRLDEDKISRSSSMQNGDDSNATDSDASGTASVAADGAAAAMPLNKDERNVSLTKHNSKLVQSLTSKISLMATLLLIATLAIYLALTRNIYTTDTSPLLAAAFAYNAYGSTSPIFYELSTMLALGAHGLDENEMAPQSLRTKANHTVPKEHAVLYYSVSGNVQLPYTDSIKFRGTFFNGTLVSDLQELPQAKALASPFGIGGKLLDLRVPFDVRFEGFEYNSKTKRYKRCMRPYTNDISRLVSASCPTVVIYDQHEYSISLAYANLYTLLAIVATTFAGLFMVLLDLSSRLFLPLIRIQHVMSKVRKAMEEFNVSFHTRFMEKVNEHLAELRRTTNDEETTQSATTHTADVSVITASEVKRTVAELECMWSPVLAADVLHDRFLCIIDEPLDALAVACSDMEKALGIPLAAEANALRAISTMFETKLPTIHSLCVAVGDRSLTPLELMTNVRLLEPSVPPPLMKTRLWKFLKTKHGDSKLSDALVGLRVLLSPAQQVLIDVIKDLVVLSVSNKNGAVLSGGEHATIVNPTQAFSSLFWTQHPLSSVDLGAISLGDVEDSFCDMVRPHVKWAIDAIKGDVIVLTQSAESVVENGRVPELFFFLQVVFKHRICHYARTELHLAIHPHEAHTPVELFRLLEKRGVKKLLQRAKTLGIVAKNAKAQTFDELRVEVEMHAINRVRDEVKERFGIAIPMLKSVSLFRKELIKYLSKQSPTLKFAIALTQRVAELERAMIHTLMKGPIITLAVFEDDELVDLFVASAHELIERLATLGELERKLQHDAHVAFDPSRSMVLAQVASDIREALDPFFKVLREASMQALAMKMRSEDQAEAIAKSVRGACDAALAQLEGIAKHVAVAEVEAEERLKRSYKAAQKITSVLSGLIRNIAALCEAESDQARSLLGMLLSSAKSLCIDQLYEMLPRDLLGRLDERTLDALGLPNWRWIADGAFGKDGPIARLFGMVQNMLEGHYMDMLRGTVTKYVDLAKLGPMLGSGSTHPDGKVGISISLAERLTEDLGSYVEDKTLMGTVQEEVKSYVAVFGHILKDLVARLKDIVNSNAPIELLTNALTHFSPPQLQAVFPAILENLSLEAMSRVVNQLAEHLPIDAVAQFARTAINTIAPDAVPAVVEYANASIARATPQIAALRARLSAIIAGILIHLPAYGEARDAIEVQLFALANRFVPDQEQRQRLVSSIANTVASSEASIVQLLNTAGSSSAQELVATVSQLFAGAWEALSESTEGRAELLAAFVASASRFRVALVSLVESAASRLADDLLDKASAGDMRSAAALAIAALPAFAGTLALARAAAVVAQSLPLRSLQPLIANILKLVPSEVSSTIGSGATTILMLKLNEMAAGLPMNELGRSAFDTLRASLEAAAAHAHDSPAETIASVVAQLQGNTAALELLFHALFDFVRNVSKIGSSFAAQTLDALFADDNLDHRHIWAALRAALARQFPTLTLMQNPKIISDILISSLNALREPKMTHLIAMVANSTVRALSSVFGDGDLTRIMQSFAIGDAKVVHLASNGEVQSRTPSTDATAAGAPPTATFEVEAGVYADDDGNVTFVEQGGTGGT